MDNRDEAAATLKRNMKEYNASKRECKSDMEFGLTLEKISLFFAEIAMFVYLGSKKKARHFPHNIPAFICLAVIFRNSGYWLGTAYKGNPQENNEFLCWLFTFLKSSGLHLLFYSWMVMLHVLYQVTVKQVLMCKIRLQRQYYYAIIFGFPIFINVISVILNIFINVISVILNVYEYNPRTKQCMMTATGEAPYFLLYFHPTIGVIVFLIYGIPVIKTLITSGGNANYLARSRLLMLREEAIRHTVLGVLVFIVAVINAYAGIERYLTQKWDSTYNSSFIRALGYYSCVSFRIYRAFFGLVIALVFLCTLENLKRVKKFLPNSNRGEGHSSDDTLPYQQAHTPRASDGRDDLMARQKAKFPSGFDKHAQSGYSIAFEGANTDLRTNQVLQWAREKLEIDGINLNESELVEFVSEVENSGSTPGTSSEHRVSIQENDDSQILSEAFVPDDKIEIRFEETKQNWIDSIQREADSSLGLLPRRRRIFSFSIFLPRDNVLSKMFITKMEMENFKSFEGKHFVYFKNGLNVITGANGSGKSCVLEAINFALGQGASNLRVKNLKELICRSGKSSSGNSVSFGFAKVTLYFESTHSTEKTYLLSATLTLNSADKNKSNALRVFRWQNKIKSLNDIKQLLKSCINLNTDTSSLWYIPQRDADKMASATPASLGACLCQASGTSLLMESTAHASDTISSFNSSKARIERNIKTLESQTNRYKKILQARALQKSLEMEIETRSKNIAEAIATMASRPTAKTDTELEIILKQKELEEARRKLSSMEGIGEEDDATSLCELLADQTAHLSSLSNTYENKIRGQEKLRKKIESLVQKHKALSGDINTPVDVTGMMNFEGFKEASEGLFCLLETEIRNALPENPTSIISSEKLLKVLENFESCFNPVKSDAEIRLQKLEMQIAESRHGACVETNGGVCRYLKEFCGQYKSPSALSNSIAKLKSSLGIITSDIQGDYGTLQEHITVTNEKSLFIPALSKLVFQKKPPIHLCDSFKATAQAMLRNSKSIGQDIVIWPMDTLKAPTVTRAQNISYIDGKDYCYPSDLLSVDIKYPSLSASNVNSCIDKACGKIVLTSNDTISSALVVSPYYIPSISSESLSTHTPGVLFSSSERPGGNNIIADYQKLRIMEKKYSEIQRLQSECDRHYSKVAEFKALKLTVQQEKQLINSTGGADAIAYRSRIVTIAKDLLHSECCIEISVLDFVTNLRQACDDIKEDEGTLERISDEIEELQDCLRTCKVTTDTLESQIKASRSKKSELEDQLRDLNEKAGAKKELEHSISLFESALSKLKKSHAEAVQAKAELENKALAKEKQSLKDARIKLGVCMIESSGSTDKSDDPSVSRAVLDNQLLLLSSLKASKATLDDSIKQLVLGLKTSQSALSNAIARAYKKVAAEFEEVFHLLIPTKNARLCCVKADDGRENPEQGLYFELLKNKGSASGSSIQSLSGGQCTLLGLAFLFSLTSIDDTEGATNPLYLLDEIDAALDESNQALIASLITSRFASKGSQVICVSHHTAFHDTGKSSSRRDSSNNNRIKVVKPLNASSQIL